MNVTDFARALRRRWLIVLLALLVGGGAGVGAAHLAVPKYSAQATLYIAAAPPPGSTSSAAYELEQVALRRVKSYLPLVDDPKVLEEAVRRAALPVSPRQLATRVAVSSPLDSVLIDIAATDSSPALAAAEANAVGTVFAEQSARLNPAPGPDGSSELTVFVVQPASAPDVPSSMSPLVMIMIGVLAGLVLGIALALVLHVRDRRIRSRTDLAEALAAPVLGALPAEPRKQTDTLIVVAEPHSEHAEGHRRLRTSLPVLRGEVPGSVVLVGSPSTGEGRTTVALDLAATAAAAGSRVLVVDADLRRPAIATRLGLEDRRGLTDLLGDKVSHKGGHKGGDEADVAADDVVWHVGRGMFDVLTTGEVPFAPAEALGSPGMRELVAGLRREYDLVLIDSSPLLPVTDVASLAPVTDGALLLCRQDRTRSDELVEAARILGTVSTPVLGTVLTHASVSRRSRRHRKHYLAEPPATSPRAVTPEPTVAEPTRPADDPVPTGLEAPTVTLTVSSYLGLPRPGRA